MRYIFLVLFLFIVNVTWSQSFDVSNPDYNLLESLIKKEINQFRHDQGLSPMNDNMILKDAADHHSAYMSRTTIVSHYQDMVLSGFHQLHSPKDRIKHFSGNTINKNNHYAEIVLGLRLKNDNTYLEVAEKIFSAILQSENKAILNNNESFYIGLSVNNKKRTFFTTINIGMGYDNIIALLEDN